MSCGRKKARRANKPDDALPRARYDNRRLSERAQEKKQWREKRTFSVDPQQGACRLPFDDNPPLKQPDGGSLVLSLLSNVVICGRIGGREPCSEEFF